MGIRTLGRFESEEIARAYARVSLSRAHARARLELNEGCPILRRRFLRLHLQNPLVEALIGHRPPRRLTVTSAIAQAAHRVEVDLVALPMQPH